MDSIDMSVTEGRLACLATDINAILYLYLTFLFSDARTSVSDIQTVAQPARILWGEVGLSKIRACLYFGKCGNLRTVSKFVGNKTAIYHRNHSSSCLLFVKLALPCVFSPFIRPTTYARASWEHAFDAGGSTKPASHNRDGSEMVRTFDKRTHHHKPFDRQRFVSVLWLRHARLHNLVEVWAPMSECSPPDQNRSIFFVQTFVDFALTLPGHSL